MDTVSLNERRRNGEREEVRREWPPGTGLSVAYIYVHLYVLDIKVSLLHYRKMVTDNFYKLNLVNQTPE